MDGIIRYCVVKKHKGKFKKEPIYTHLFFVPIDPQQYMYLGLIGKDLDDVPNTYAAKLLIKLPEEITDQTIQGEHEYFGKKFIDVEALNCTATNPFQGKYHISIPQKGVYIKSDLEMEYQLELSTVEMRIYKLSGKINLISKELENF